MMNAIFTCFYKIFDSILGVYKTDIIVMDELQHIEDEILKKRIKKEITHVYSNISSDGIDVVLHSIVCRDSIKKPILLLVHGTFGSIITFSNCIDYLSNYFQVHVIDLPGFGRSICSEEKLIKFSNEQVLNFYVKILKNYIDNVIKVDKVTLLGYSMGGLISVQFSEKYDRYIDKLILVSPAGVFPFTSKFTFYYGLLFKLAFPQCLFRLLGDKVIRFFRNRMNELDYYNTMVLTQKHSFGYKLVSKFITFEFTSGLCVYHNYPVLYKLLNLKCKTSLIYNEIDSLIPLENGIKIRKMCRDKIPLYVLKNDKHLISHMSADDLSIAILYAYNNATFTEYKRNTELSDMYTLLEHKCTFDVFKSKKIIQNFYQNVE